LEQLCRSGPKIQKIQECKEFPSKLTRRDKAAWNSFVTVGNHKVQRLCGAG